MKLETAYRVELTKRTPTKKLIQYVEATSCDEAEKKAKASFDAVLYGFDKVNGSMVQKACDKTVLNERLSFGFKGGWITVDCSGLSIFDALKKASLNAFVVGEINEISTPVSYFM